MWQTLVICVAALGALWDIRCRKIPNYLTLAGVTAGIIVHFHNTGWAGFLFSLQGLAAGLLLLLVPFAMGGIGGGDVKLLAAIGALGGTGFVFTSALAAGVAGGVMALGLLCWRGLLAQTCSRLCWDGYRLYTGLRPVGKSTGITFPYGVAIALGTLITLAVW